MKADRRLRRYDCSTNFVTGGAVKKRVVSDEALKRATRRSTKASAKLEGRVVPDDHVQSEAVRRYIDEVSARHSSQYRRGDEQPDE